MKYEESTLYNGSHFYSVACSGDFSFRFFFLLLSCDFYLFPANGDLFHIYWAETTPDRIVVASSDGFKSAPLAGR